MFPSDIPDFPFAVVSQMSGYSDKYNPLASAHVCEVVRLVPRSPVATVTTCSEEEFPPVILGIQVSLGKGTNSLTEAMRNMINLVAERLSTDLFREYSTVHFFRIVPKGRDGKLVSITHDQLLQMIRVDVRIALRVCGIKRSPGTVIP